MNKEQLIATISDLYRLSKENKAFLHARFSVGDDPLAHYKKIINDCMYPNIDKNKPIQIAKAKNAINFYKQAVDNSHGEAELMIFFVECGNNFTLDFGDIDEGFYNALNLMYSKAIDKVLSLPKEDQNELKNRLKEIMTSSSNIGWGYYDMLYDDYYNGFPEDE